MKNNWTELLGWDKEQIDEIRFFGFSLLREGKYERARLFFEVLLILDGTSAFDRQTLGALYLEIGENEQAVSQLDHALSLEPAHEPTLLNKAKALFTLQHNDEAIAIAERLQKSTNEIIANDAEALIMTHR